MQETNSIVRTLERANAFETPNTIANTEIIMAPGADATGTSSASSTANINNTANVPGATDIPDTAAAAADTVSIPGATDIPDTAAAVIDTVSIPSAADTTGTSSASSTANINNAANVPNATDVPDAADVPNAAGVPSTIDTTETSSASSAAGTTNTANIPNPRRKVIAALIPIYHSRYGNATNIMYLGGDSHIVPRTIKTVLKNIAKENTFDIKASREKYGKLLGCGRAAPIPINEETVLIPLKMRRVISKNDSARGYINCLIIKDVIDQEREHYDPTSSVAEGTAKGMTDQGKGYYNRDTSVKGNTVEDVKRKGEGPVCIVILQDQRRIRCLHSKRNIKQHIRNCHFVHTKLSGMPGADHQAVTDYLNCPATKSDIAMLIKEIRELGEKV